MAGIDWEELDKKDAKRRRRTRRLAEQEVFAMLLNTDGVAAIRDIGDDAWAAAELQDAEAGDEAFGAAEKGSSTSGNYGHRGRPGQVGGSAPGGGHAAIGLGNASHAERQAAIEERRLARAADMERLRELVRTRDWQRFDDNDADLRSATERWFSGLEQEEVAAINSYTGSGFYAMNQSLRNDETPNDVIQKRIARLDQALTKAPVLDKDIMVFRGINYKRGEEWQPGKLKHDKGFCSTSVNEEFAKDWGTVLVKIYVPAGRRATYIGDKGLSFGEGEFLLPRNSKFFVLNRAGNEIEAVLLP